MSKLYLTGDTDMVHTYRTARGNKRVDATIGYNESDYSRKIRTTVTRDDDKIEITIIDKNQTLLVCDGTTSEGIIKCQPYNWAGPYPWMDMKRLKTD